VAKGEKQMLPHKIQRAPTRKRESIWKFHSFTMRKYLFILLLAAVLATSRAVQLRGTDQTKEEDEERSLAVLLSGQCSRFVYKNQEVPFFTGTEKWEVFIALQCGEQKKPMYGDTVDSPPYMKTVNVTDITDWYTAKGAASVEVKIIDDHTMDKRFEQITTFATRIHGEEGRDGGSQIADGIRKGRFIANGHALRWHRWSTEARKLYLRHVVYAMASRKNYDAYVYMREDNYPLEPLDMNQAYFSLSGQADGPLVVVDEHCTFEGSYSDKMYLANGQGADLLFGGTMPDFLQKMKLYALMGFYRKDFTGEPLQPEAFVHDSLQIARVVKYNMKRTDVRYKANQKCVPQIYYWCMPWETRAAMSEHNIVVCEDVDRRQKKLVKAEKKIEEEAVPSANVMLGTEEHRAAWTVPPEDTSSKKKDTENREEEISVAAQ
jgi:hypothetical protein